MPEALELPSLTAAAARAAADGDIPTAAALLRQVAELQTSILGPDHPDVATTLNNLALMLEKLGHMTEAGQCYRRAHAVAAAALGPDDPVVQVSRANLDAFSATYALPDASEDAALFDPAVWGTLGDFPAHPAAPVVPDVTSAPPPLMQLQGKPRPAPARERQPDPSPELAFELAPPPVKAPVARPAGRGPSGASRSARAAVTGYLVATVVLAALTAWWWGRSASPRSTGVTSPEIVTAAEAPPPEAMPAPVPARPGTSSAREGVPAGGPPSATSSPAASRPPGENDVGVTDARLCSALTRTQNPWACTAVTSPVSGGAVYYYTRVRATRDMTVRHRWTLDGRLVQDVRRQIRANPAEGFRTFSRQTVSGLGAGTWVATLVGPDGETLDEKRFEVR